MKIRIVLICFLVVLTLTATAQKRKVAAAPTPTPEEIEYQEKMARMIAATEKVMFIDSVVVDKDKFLQYYNLNPESGRIARYQDEFKSKRNPNCTVFFPATDKRYYLSQENNEGRISLYFCDVVNKKMSRPSKVHGINDDKRFTRVNYPFMLGDGQTLYFAAEGPEGLGGYDIYVTRYDAGKDRFMKCENIGMPFNSEANDYMFVIDEYDSLGWFATDRNQEEGKVCIYTFIPPTIRETYDTDVYTPEQIRQFACIHDISATWDDRQALEAAQTRIRLAAMRKSRQTTGREFTFVINDDIVYTKLSDFKAPQNRNRYHRLMALHSQYNQLCKTIAKARATYPSASKEDREDIREELIPCEQKQQELYRQIQIMEKTIRNNEILFITKKK